MRGATFSGLDRIEKCPASAVLPQVRVITEVDPKNITSLGTVVHEFLKNVSLSGLEAALEAAPPDFRQELEGLDLSSLPASDPESYVAEVALAWDVVADTGRELHRGRGDRDYSAAKPNEIPGTVDVVGLTADAVNIYDYKRGHRWLGPAAESLQLLAGALAACRAYGRRKAHVAFIRILSDGEARYIRADLDMLDLDAGAERIRAIVAAVEAAELLQVERKHPALTEGAHCRYCPAFSVCPAKKELAAYLAQPEEGPVLTAETLPKVLERLEAAEAVLKKVRESVEEFAHGTPVTLPDGAIYGAVETTRESIDPVKGAAVLGAGYGAALAQSAVETESSITKANLERVLKVWMQKNPGHKVSHLMKAALTALREAGAISTSVYTNVKRVYPRELKAGKAA